jgi:lipopolysaccharide export system protein LptA
VINTTAFLRIKPALAPFGFLFFPVLFLLSAFCFLFSVLAAPPIPLGLENYSYPQYFPPPNETQLKTLIKGARADPLDPQSNRTRVTKARLEFYRTNGAPEMTVEADQCVSDKIEQLVNSAEALRAWTADGKFLIEGVGFLFRQTNKDLIISNRVHTIILSELLDTSTPNATSNTSASELREIEIFSDRFHGSVAEGVGVYTSRLRVTGTNLNVTGGILTVKFPPGGDSQRPSGIESLLIETNAVMDFANENGAHKQVFHITGALAYYVASNGLFYVRGDPTWSAELQQGRGDELIIDRTNKIFTANGHGYLIMPGQTSGQSSFLSRPGAPPARKAEKEFIEVRSDHYQFRTNFAVFSGGVEVRDLVEQQTQGTMTCGRMIITFSGSNELQRLVAENGVVIQQETNRLTGGHAVYTATNGVLELSEVPAWEAGTRQGNGDEVQLRSQQNEMFVRGHASLRLPAESFGSASPAAPKRSEGGSSSTVSASPPKTKNSQFAQILCDSYTLGQTNGHFVGGVSITHPEINWQCGDLNVYWPSGGGHVEKMVAERSVRFTAITQKGEKSSGTGDEAVYTYSVADGVTNEVLQLTGNPATLVGTNGINFRNAVINYDLGRQQIIATGAYRASSGSTNNSGSKPSLLPQIPATESKPRKR